MDLGKNEKTVKDNTFTIDGKKYVLAYCNSTDTTTIFEDIGTTYVYVNWFYGSIPEGITISDDILLDYIKRS